MILTLFEAIGNLALVGGFDRFVNGIAVVRGFVKVDESALVGGFVHDIALVGGFVDGFALVGGFVDDIALVSKGFSPSGQEGLQSPFGCRRG